MAATGEKMPIELKTQQPNLAVSVSGSRSMSVQEENGFSRAVSEFPRSIAQRRAASFERPKPKELNGN